MSCKILKVVRVRPKGAHSHNLFRIAIAKLSLQYDLKSQISSFHEFYSISENHDKILDQL